MKFKIGDKIRGIEGETPYTDTIRAKNFQGEVVEVGENTFSAKVIKGNSKLTIGYVFNYLEDQYFELINKPMETEIGKIKDFDKDALAEAKKEIEEERADAQKETAKVVLRDLMNKKDEAIARVKEIDAGLKETATAINGETYSIVGNYKQGQEQAVEEPKAEEEVEPEAEPEKPEEPEEPEPTEPTEPKSE